MHWLQFIYFLIWLILASQTYFVMVSQSDTKMILLCFVYFSVLHSEETAVEQEIVFDGKMFKVIIIYFEVNVGNYNLFIDIYIYSTLSHYLFIIIFSYEIPSQVKSLSKMFILSRSINKHCRHSQFLFLIGWFLKNLLVWNCLAKWSEAW